MRVCPAVVILLLLLGAVLPGAGCRGRHPAARTEGGPVERIVFLARKDACECTKKRIDVSWGALQAAVEGKDVPVERVDDDVDEEKAKALTDLMPVMALPGLYFMGKDGKLVELLQGEVTPDQVAKALGGFSAPR